MIVSLAADLATVAGFPDPQGQSFSFVKISKPQSYRLILQIEAIRLCDQESYRYSRLSLLEGVAL
jgi:hypothetical protein